MVMVLMGMLLSTVHVVDWYQSIPIEICRVDYLRRHHGLYILHYHFLAVFHSHLGVGSILLADTARLLVGLVLFLELLGYLVKLILVMSYLLLDGHLRRV